MQTITLHERLFLETKVINGCINKYEQDEKLLFERYFALCMHIAMRYCSNREDAEEVVNDSFMKIFRKLDQFDKSKKLKPWIAQIVTNTAIDYHRKRQVTKVQMPIETLTDDFVNYLPEENDLLNDIENMDSVLPLIRALSPQYRVVFNLFVFEEYSHQEISQRLGISVGTSKSNLSKAKAVIREKINSDKKFLDFKKNADG